MRFHFLERPREIGDARAMRWRDLAIAHRAHAEHVADDPSDRDFGQPG